MIDANKYFRTIFGIQTGAVLQACGVDPVDTHGFSHQLVINAAQSGGF